MPRRTAYDDSLLMGLEEVCEKLRSEENTMNENTKKRHQLRIPRGFGISHENICALPFSSAFISNSKSTNRHAQ